MEEVMGGGGGGGEVEGSDGGRWWRGYDEWKTDNYYINCSISLGLISPIIDM